MGMITTYVLKEVFEKHCVFIFQSAFQDYLVYKNSATNSYQLPGGKTHCS